MRYKLKSSFLTIVAVITLYCSMAVYGETYNWQYWKGPNLNGISDESNWDPECLKRPLKVNWKINVGFGYSNVGIYNDHLYTIGFDKETKLNTLYCLNVKSGEKIWDYTYGSTKGKWTGPKGSPVIDEGLVYTFSQDGQFFCNDAKTGKLKWKKDLIKDFGAKKLMWEFSSSVCIEGDAAILNACESGIAFNKKTGALLWKSKPGAGNHSTPVTFKFRKKTYAAIYGKKHLYAVDVDNGKVLWSFPWETTYTLMCADPYIYDGKLFISTGYGNGCALLDISKGKPVELWRNKDLSTHFSTVVIIDGFIYGIDGNTGTDGLLKCLDMKDGSVRWSKELGFGNMMAAGGHLIMVTEKGSLYIVKADPDSYKEVSMKEDILTKLCWTSPVLCRSTIYLRSNTGDLISIDVSKQ